MQTTGTWATYFIITESNIVLESILSYFYTGAIYDCDPITNYIAALQVRNYFIRFIPSRRSCEYATTLKEN